MISTIIKLLSCSLNYYRIKNNNPVNNIPRRISWIDINRKRLIFRNGRSIELTLYKYKVAHILSIYIFNEVFNEVYINENLYLK